MTEKWHDYDPGSLTELTHWGNLVLEEVAVDRFRVVAMATAGSRSQVYEHLARLKSEEPEIARRVFAFLNEELASDGPPRATEKSNTRTKKLRNEIFEFRLLSRPEPAYRLYWFFGGGAALPAGESSSWPSREVVCVLSYLKRNTSSPPGALDDAIRLRALYSEYQRGLTFRQGRARL